jgi:hypothetical protein
MDHTDEATFNRLALLLGLVSVESVKAWADRVVESDPSPPSALIDVALAPAELTALRAALEPMCEHPEPFDVVRKVLGIAARDLASGRRSVGDTVNVLSQMRRMVALPEAILVDLDTLEDDHMLAHAGVTNDIDAVAVRIRSWLAPYATTG